MRRVLWAAALALCASAAHAADKPAFLPPASWVHPAPPYPGTSADSAATRLLLFDQQAHFGPEGVSIYTETVSQLQTPQGVMSVGTLALAWNPDTDQLVVHKLHILRGAEVIDVLAKQGFTVLRRENNLEAAQLDGVLTAAIQPEDLRVGDRLDLAWTVTTKDPALAGRAEATLGAPNVPIGDLLLHATAEPHVELRWRGTEDLAKAKFTAGSAGRELGIEIKDAAPLDVPVDAPIRYRLGRRIELSEFGSWAEISALMAPLYAKAALLAPTSPLKAEAAKIRAEDKDPKDQAAAALRLVQDQVRYLALTMNDGGLVPADADLTWSRRFGDCKGKTVLLIALLHELGVTAQPALVNTQIGDGLDARLPSMQSFDHVLVLATIAGRAYWLDGARVGDWSLDSLAVPAFSWALPVQNSGARLTRMDVAPLDKPDNLQSLTLDASAGLDAPAKAHAEQVLRGDGAISLNIQLSNLSPAQTETVLKTAWKKTYDFIEPKSVSASFDAQTGEERLLMDGSAAMAWDTLSDGYTRRYLTDGYQMGWKPDWKRAPGPYAQLPVLVPHPSFAEAKETIVLPRKGEGFTVDGDDVDKQVGVWVLQRKSAIKDGVFTMDATGRSLSAEIAASDIATVTKAMTDLTTKQVHVRAPADFTPTPQDLDELASRTPSDADAYVDRGMIFLHNSRPKLASADFQRAVTLDPQSTIAEADLALAEMDTGDLAKARADLNKAATMKGHQDAVFQGYGVLAMRQGAYLEAVAAFSRAVEVRSSDLYSLRQRAFAYTHLLKVDKALDDTAELLRQNPGDVSVHNMRISFFFLIGEKDKALAEADAEVADDPNNASAHTVRADALARMGRRAEANAEWDKSLKIAPSADAYLNRADNREQTDYAGVIDDLTAALAFRPDDTRTQRWRATVESEMGAHDKALQHIDDVIKQEPSDVDVRLDRAQILVRSGRLKEAAAEFIWARAKSADDAQALNALCWAQATVNVTLKDALADCDASLKLAPKLAQTLDSRAFVLLRLGRYQESIASYSLALASDPAEAMSLYGRGIAKLRDGDANGGQADMAQARAIGFKVEGAYQSYGVHP